MSFTDYLKFRFYEWGLGVGFIVIVVMICAVVSAIAANRGKGRK